MALLGEIEKAVTSTKILSCLFIEEGRTHSKVWWGAQGSLKVWHVHVNLMRYTVKLAATVATTHLLPWIQRIFKPETPPLKVMENYNLVFVSLVVV